MIATTQRIFEIQNSSIVSSCSCNICNNNKIRVRNKILKNTFSIDFDSYSSTFLVYKFKNTEHYIAFLQIGYDSWESFYCKSKCPLQGDDCNLIPMEDLFEELADNVKEKLLFNLDLFRI